MNRSDLSWLLARGLFGQLNDASMEYAEEAMEQLGVQLKDGDREMLQAGIAAGVKTSVEWLIEHSFIKEPVE